MSSTESGDRWQLVAVRASDDGPAFHCVVDRHSSGEALLSWSAVLALLRDSADFQRQFTAQLLAVNGRQQPFFWECAPVSRAELSAQPFACAAVPTHAFARLSCDRAPFASHLDANARSPAPQPTVAFPNLSGDAVLVVPAAAAAADCTHLHAFLTTADDALLRHFWSSVAANTLAFLDSPPSLPRAKHRTPASPLWLSTSGLGVYYLHVRISVLPKYYSFEPFKSADFYRRAVLRR